ncbi:MAG: LLM class flavin-dependent oxidoreductase [Chloroflexi bacterium]|nr:LLM class flavin-dependent oxidoreductase [Chloroflexota bacterium]
MKIGLFLNTQSSSENSLAQQITDSAEQVRAAREAGFDLIGCGEHYLSAPYQMAAALPFLARMAAEAGDMQVAASVLLLPLHNPVALAENLATMDAICNGRFVFGIGLGYRDEEYASFGVTTKDRVGRMREVLEATKLLLTEDEVEYNGRYCQVPKTRSTTRTIQKPHPPIWMAANADAAIRRAARWGYAWLVNPHATMTTVAGQLTMYREELAKAGQPPPPDMPMIRELYVASDRDEAYAESQPFLQSKYAAYASWGQDKALPGQESFSVPYEDLARDRFLLGSPEDVVAEIKRYGEELGINYLVFRMQWPGMPQARALEQIDRMGREVIPRVKG